MAENDDISKVLKEKGFVMKEDIDAMLKKQNTNDSNMINVNEVIDHMNSCTSDDCGIHKNISSKEGVAMKKGIVLGYNLGKKQK